MCKCITNVYQIDLVFQVHKLGPYRIPPTVASGARHIFEEY